MTEALYFDLVGSLERRSIIRGRTRWWRTTTLRLISIYLIVMLQMRTLRTLITVPLRLGEDPVDNAFVGERERCVRGPFSTLLTTTVKFERCGEKRAGGQ